MEYNFIIFRRITRGQKLHSHSVVLSTNSNTSSTIKSTTIPDLEQNTYEVSNEVEMMLSTNPLSPPAANSASNDSIISNIEAVG